MKAREWTGIFQTPNDSSFLLAPLRTQLFSDKIWNLPATSALPKLVETLGFVLSLNSFFLCRNMENLNISVVDSVMKCDRYLHVKSIIALDFFLRRQELEMANGAELHTPSLQKWSALLSSAD